MMLRSTEETCYIIVNQAILGIGIREKERKMTFRTRTEKELYRDSKVSTDTYKKGVYPGEFSIVIWGK
jgi:hypothetical protein